MKILVAPDKFKGSLTAAEVASHLAAGVTSVAGAAADQLPLADGGDGSVAAAVASGFGSTAVDTVGPTMEPVSAAIAFDGHTAVVEVANTCGISLLPHGRLEPLTSTSFGFGLALRAALRLHPQRIVLALGGSASTDGGAGMLLALGATLTDRDGQAISGTAADLLDLHAVDLSGVPALDGCDVVVATDVTAPLLGPTGSAEVFGPQKGAGQADVRQLDAGLRHFASVVDSSGVLATQAGAGSAGGLGFAALLLGGRVVSGAEYFLDLLDFDTHVAGADVVITGEGRIDDQTLQGKLPQVVAQRSRLRPVHVVVGASALSIDPPPWFTRVHQLGDYTAADTRTDLALTARLLTQIGRVIALESRA